MANSFSTLIPRPVQEKLFAIRDRVRELKKRYGSLARYGYPVLQSRDEVVALIYANKFSGISINELANVLGLEKMTLYRWIRGYEKKGCLRIYIDGRVEEVCVSLDEVKSTVEEEWLKPSSRRYIKEVYESKCVQEFLKNPVKRALTAPDIHGDRFSEKKIKTILARLAAVVQYINEHRDQYPDLPSNPDEWSKEHEGKLLEIITKVAQERLVKKKRGMQGLRRLVRAYLIDLRALPCIGGKNLFKGKVGAAVKTAIPIEATLYLDHFLKLKQLWKTTSDNELKAFAMIAFVHIWTGAREGWSALKTTVAKLKNLKEPDELDLDDPNVDVGLIGLKWSRAIWSPDGKLLGFRIWETKTGTEWVLQYRWLDEEMADELERIYREYARAKGIDSVVKSILVYYGVKPRNGKWSVKAFRNWYSRWVKRLVELLGLPEQWRDEMTPHRLRSAHISILAELRIPLEIVLSNVGFGSGWFDLNTARVHYLRFSQPMIGEYLNRARRIYAEREQRVVATGRG